MEKIIFILAIVLRITQVNAEDSLLKMYILSENIRDIVLKSPYGHPMPNREFHLTTMQSDQMKALVLMDDSMRTHLEAVKGKKDCNKTGVQLDKETEENARLEKRVDNRNFQIGATIFTSDTKYEQNALGRFMDDDYLNYMGQLSTKGNKKSEDIYSVETLIEQFKKSNPKVKLESLSFQEKEKILSEYAEKYLGEKLPSGLLMKEMAYQDLINNSSSWKETLAVAKNKLSTDQKIQLVSKLGGSFSNVYNDDRAKKSDGEVVNLEQLLNSVKTGDPGGICRDVALAQTQMLKELGFINNYVVAFKTLEGSHATTITMDPATGKVIKFNYDETYESKKGSGTEVLTQDTSIPDHGLGFRIYDTNGKPVTQVPSELSQMMRESTGADVAQNFTPRNYSLTNANFKTAYVDGSLFIGKTSMGENVYGFSLYKNVAVNKYLSLGGGAAASKLEGNRSFVKMEQQNLYLRANAELLSPTLKLGPVSSKAFAGGSGEGLISNNKETNLIDGKVSEAKNELDGNASAYVGVKNTYKTPDEKTSIESKIYSNFYPDWTNVATENKHTGVLDSFVVKTGVTHEFSDETRALLDTTVILKNYGTSIVAKAAFEDDKNNIRYNAGFATPLSKDMPSFLPGGETRAFAGIEKGNEKMMFTLMYERNFDSDSNNFLIKGEVKL